VAYCGYDDEPHKTSLRVEQKSMEVVSELIRDLGSFVSRAAAKAYICIRPMVQRTIL